MNGRWTDYHQATSGAWVSKDGVYRTFLWRRWDTTKPPLVFGMLNPSTADARVDDATIRRCMGFAYRDRYGGVVVVNASPYRATEPRELTRAHKAGEDIYLYKENLEAIEIAQRFGPIVLAYGSGYPACMRGAIEELRNYAGRNPRCLGVTQDGSPRHPLFVRKGAAIMAYGGT